MTFSMALFSFPLNSGLENTYSAFINKPLSLCSLTWGKNLLPALPVCSVPSQKACVWDSGLWNAFWHFLLSEPIHSHFLQQSWRYKLQKTFLQIAGRGMFLARNSSGCCCERQRAKPKGVCPLLHSLALFWLAQDGRRGGLGQLLGLALGTTGMDGWGKPRVQSTAHRAEEQDPVPIQLTVWQW